MFFFWLRSQLQKAFFFFFNVKGRVSTGVLIEAIGFKNVLKQIEEGGREKEEEEERESKRRILNIRQLEWKEKKVREEER